MKKKSIGIVSLSALLSLSLLTPAVGAVSVKEEKNLETSKIEIASVTNVISKNELMKRVNELFPGKFSHLTSNDFHVGTSHRFPEDDDETVRHNLNFSKEINGKYVHGDFEFIGEDLQLNRFYYQPVDDADAIFPPKVSREEAQEIASQFLSQVYESTSDYKPATNNIYYNNSNQTLTEPIRYDFMYEKYKNGVPVTNQNINITVLGNGEVTSFNGPYYQTEKFTYEDVSQAKTSEEILNQIKENFQVDLQYLVEFDYRTQKASVRLAYLPLPTVNGVHALTGDWMVRDELVEDIPNSKEFKMLVESPLQTKNSSFSLEEAKELAEKLLHIDGVEGLKLNIEGIDERTNYQGKEVIAVNYMYHMGNSGTGTSFEVDKNGEIVQYHDLKEQLLRDYGKQEAPTKELTYDEALQLAVQYAKEYAPSYLHNFAYPTVKETKAREGYHFIFPRVKNGLIVSNEGLNIGISSNGSLSSFNVNLNDIEKWPSVEDVVSEEEVVNEYLKQLNVELRYLNNYWETNSNKYQLVYTTKYHDKYQFIDATSGEWASYSNGQVEAEKSQEVNDHWAKEELNFMINAGIITVDDENTFNPDEVATKGEALEVMMKSLTRFYDYHYGGEKQPTYTFENIKPDHDLFQIVERAVNLGILEKDQKQFAIDEPLTRQELAVWYIRVLGLEEAAKHSYIYKADFADASSIKKENIGYVALMNALGVLTTNNNEFRPEQEVTLSQLAVSSFRLAKHASNNERLNRY